MKIEKEGIDPVRRQVIGGILVTGAAAVASGGWVGRAFAESGRHRPSGSTTSMGGPRLRSTLHVDTGSQPKSVTSYPDGSRVVVCHFGYLDGGNVGIYNADSLVRVGTVDFHGNAVESAFSPDGGTLWVSNFRRHVVHAIDPESYRIRGEVSVGRHPKWMVLSADGSRLFVANWAGSNVSVVDTARMTEVQRLPAGRHPRGMAVTAEGVLYVAPFEEHHIRQYDPPGYEEVHRFPTCRFPRHLVLAPDDSRLYYSCSSNRQLRWLDMATGRVEGIVPVGENPRSIDISVDGRFVATADFDSSSVCLVDTVALTHRRYDVPGADRIVGVAIRKSSPLRVYATSWNNSRLYALDPAEPVTISVPVRREEPRISRVPAPAPAPAPAPESAPAPAPAPAASDLPSIWSRIAEFLGSAGR